MADDIEPEFSYEKTETEAFDAKVEVSRLLAFYHEPGKVYALNDHVRPLRETGFAYKQTATGLNPQTSRRPPVWPVVFAGIVKDGSVTWEAVAIDGNSADSIASVNVPSVIGLTIGSVTFSGTRITVPISGGTKLVTYTVSVEITTSTGEVFEVKIEVFVKSE